MAACLFPDRESCARVSGYNAGCRAEECRDASVEARRVYRGPGRSEQAREQLIELNRAALAWVDGAKCRSVDPDLFFPERGESTADAKAVCRDCPVRAECLAYALRANVFEGIWGGLSGRERQRVLRQRRVAESITHG